MRISDWSSDVCSSDLFDLKEHSKRAARLAGSARGRLSPNWIASAVSAITTFQLEQWQGHLRSQTEQCTLNDCPAGASGRSTLVSARTGSDELFFLVSQRKRSPCSCLRREP